MDEFSAQIDALKREPVARLREPEQLEWLLHALGRANEGRQLDDVRHLIEEALDGRDGLPVLRSELATRFFALGLSSAHAPARRLACEQLARLATPDDVRTLVESGALALLGALVADPELAVAHAARACLVAAARSCASSELEQDLVLTPQLLAELSGFASRPGPKNAPVRMRALEVSAQCASLSPRAFAACQRAGLLQMLVGSWLSDDVLEKLAALEILLDVASASPAGLALLAGDVGATPTGAPAAAAPPTTPAVRDALADVVRTLEQSIDGTHPDALSAVLLAAPILSFVARLATAGVAQHAALLERGALRASGRALAAAPSDEVAVAALDALQALGGSHGARALGELLGQTAALEHICSLAEEARTPRAVRAAAVRALGRLLGAATAAGELRAGEYATLETAAQRALARESTTLVSALLAGATSADEEMRHASFDCLHALCLGERGALLVACCAPAVGWLADAAAFQAASDVPRKRDIAAALLRHPRACAHLPPSALAVLSAGGGGGASGASNGRTRPRDASAAVEGDAEMG